MYFIIDLIEIANENNSKIKTLIILAYIIKIFKFNLYLINNNSSDFK